MLSTLLALQPAASGGAPAPSLDPMLRELLLDQWRKAYDPGYGGWTHGDQVLDPDSLELALVLARQGDGESLDRARTTLDGAARLVHAASGGMRRASTARDWSEPRPEKPPATQAAALRIFALAHAQWGFAQDLAVARSVSAYVARELTAADGSFHPPGRATGPLSFVESGALIAALCMLADASGDPSPLRRAEAAARAIVARGNLDSVALDSAVALGQGFLALFSSTAEVPWLERSRKMARAAEAQLRSSSPPASLRIALARFAHRLFSWSGDPRDRLLSEQALQPLLVPREAPPDDPQPGILLATDELSRPPLHITVVGPRGDPAALTLYAAARRVPAPDKRIDLWDRSEGPLRNSPIEFPRLPRPAAFVCSATSCSLPIYDPAEVPRKAAALSGFRG